jgi:hypothetical protein
VAATVNTAAVALNQDQQAELALWNAARTSSDRVALQAYLDRYPQGSYAVLAKMFVTRLERWDDSAASRVATSRLGDSQSRFTPTSDRVPRGGPADRWRCQRLYSLLAERTQDVRLQCGPVLRHPQR